MNIKIELDSYCTQDHTMPTYEQWQNWITTTCQLAHYTPKMIAAEIIVSLSIVNKDVCAQINHTWRNKNTPTNVLAFEQDAKSALPIVALGDIVFCKPVIEEEAQIQQKNIIHHWAHLTIHGTLHLLGYDHIESEEAEHMEQLECQIMHTLGYNNPYELI